MVIVYENRGPQLAAVDYTFVVLALTTILLRCAVRVFIVRGFGIDDWLMLGAAVTFSLYSSFSIVGVHYGTGQHESLLAPMDVSAARMESIFELHYCLPHIKLIPDQYWWLCYLMYCSTMVLSKLSIGFLLLRVTSVRKLHMWIIYGAMITTVVTCVAFFIVTVFQCTPVSFFWNKDQSGSCFSMDIIIGLVYLYSTCAIITDFIFALLPAWIIVGLQLKKRTKLALIPLMAMGCIASAAVIMRSIYLPRFRNPDFLWATLDIAIWSTVEQGLAITAGSLATLRPLLRIVGSKLGLTGRPSGVGRSHYGELESSRAGYLKDQQLKSQTRAGNSTITSLREDKKASQSVNGHQTTYEVRCEAESMQGETELSHLSYVIAHGKTYEIKSEYITQPPTTDESWPIPPSESAPGMSRTESTERITRQRSESSSEPIYDEHHSPV